VGTCTRARSAVAGSLVYALTLATAPTPAVKPPTDNDREMIMTEGDRKEWPDSSVAVLDVIKIIETELAATSLHPHDPQLASDTAFQEVRGVKELYAGTAGREAELLHAALSTATRLALRLQELRKQWGDETDDLELMRAWELSRLAELDEDQDGA
jgi:hypothetical protein